MANCDMKKHSARCMRCDRKATSSIDSTSEDFINRLKALGWSGDTFVSQEFFEIGFDVFCPGCILKQLPKINKE